MDLLKSILFHASILVGATVVAVALYVALFFVVCLPSYWLVRFLIGF